MDIKLLTDKIKLYGIKKSISFGISETIGRLYRNIILGSYSQDFEDLIIDKLLGNKNNGNYIDIGAFNPERMSNTKRFYDKGWRGINVEPDYNNYLKFVEKRKEDINLNVGISNLKGEQKFFRFTIETLSTFSETEAEKTISQGFELRETISSKVTTLEDIFSSYLKEASIDFMSVDTEGHDLEVLQSNNWDVYRPKIICVENILTSEINYFLENQSYKKVATTNINSIFQDQTNLI
jgi:FkbM family methyltransferase